MAQPHIDVVLVAWGSGDLLGPAVEPLAAAPRIRVIVVDNACPVGSARYVEHLPVTVVRTSNEGWGAGACNAGAAVGAAPVILILNPDVRLTAEGARDLAARLLADPATAAADR